MSLSWFSCGSSILVELEFGVLLFVKEENQRTWSKTLGARTTVSLKWYFLLYFFNHAVGNT